MTQILNCWIPFVCAHVRVRGVCVGVGGYYKVCGGEERGLKGNTPFASPMLLSLEKHSECHPMLLSS